MQGREISNSGQEWPIALLIINRSLDLVQPMITSDPLGQDGSRAKIPTSTQTSLWQRLTSHARQRWPQVTEVQTRTGPDSPTSTPSRRRRTHQAVPAPLWRISSLMRFCD
jgi:hypothetical protein